MRKPFQINGRNGWHAEVEHADGRCERLKFESYQAAEEWLIEVQAEVKSDTAPLFGGPSGLTLGQMLGEYAARFTVTKGG